MIYMYYMSPIYKIGGVFLFILVIFNRLRQYFLIENVLTF